MTYLLAALLGAWVTLLIRRRLRALSLRRRFRRGARGEELAERLLRRLGFRIIEAQPRRTARMWIDGSPVEVEVRADYLAAKGWRTFVVEVKTGKTATDPTSRATRRQLLEYEQVYEVDGVLLADMEAQTLHEVRFAGRRRGWALAATPTLAAFLGGAAAGLWSARALFGP